MEGVKILSDGLKHNKILTSLDLGIIKEWIIGHTKMGIEGAMWIFDYLKRNRVLTSLKLSIIIYKT